ncbi:hypothetical protein SCLCIDRAFT_1225490 [Scleroderma citrinum Foug A]|uniref:Uncharacterized protein n=1 Tax=Scleroderma citrinum Foug A TaxID=1036808 RepID=A0A0C3CNE1_9AGAM|nr:hypothetical protein SCLCIDRAFT_1225490 [Scleroderma citrinum Foug A]
MAFRSNWRAAIQVYIRDLHCSRIIGFGRSLPDYLGILLFSRFENSCSPSVSEISRGRRSLRRVLQQR